MRRVPLIVDTSHLPLLQLRYIGDFTDAELELFLAEVSRAVHRPGKKCAMIDLREAVNATARQRKRQAAWIAEHAGILEREITAAVVVTDSAIMRGIVTAIFWLQSLPCPTQIEPTRARGEVWLQPYVTSLRALPLR